MSKGNSSGVKLSAKWQLDAALLSRPVDLTALVSMSKSHPDNFLEDNTLHRLVTSLLNEKNSAKSDKDTKLDVLNIMANVAASKTAVSEVRVALQGISEWFDEYMSAEESGPGQDPELHKAMVLLLARCWDYKLKTEDVLELTQGNRRIALCTVVGLLEDGETYSTTLKQKQAPGQGKIGQWEHELVCQRYEKPLLLQICRLLRGFTHPGTYFEASGEEIALYSVERFAAEMDCLLEITLQSHLVEKLALALYDCLFSLKEEEEGDDEDSYLSLLDESDHMAVVSVHAFLQNLYFYATRHNDAYRRHMLVETLLIPRLVLPYLDRCVLHVLILNNRAEAFADMLDGDQVAQMTLHNPNLVKGIAASIRSVIIASFRAPATQFVMTILRKFNPTGQMLRARAFCVYHEYIFALLCMLNINMGALDLSQPASTDEYTSVDGFNPHALLNDLAIVYALMDKEKQSRVYKRVMSSGALPLCRDTPSYAAVMSVLLGGVAGQLSYGVGGQVSRAESEAVNEGEDEVWDSRAEAKKSHADRMAALRFVEEYTAAPDTARGGTAATAASEEQVGAPAVADSKESAPPSAFAISVAIANAADEKATSKQQAASLRLLGDLPSLQPDRTSKQHRDNVRIALNLQLPSEAKAQGKTMMSSGSGGGSSSSPSTKKPVVTDSSIPAEFLCSINGHVMKDPVRNGSSGPVYERATIELWLGTRGSICPINHTPLTKEDLVPVDDLRNRIKRYHIEQTTRRTASNSEDDLYDF